MQRVRRGRLSLARREVCRVGGTWEGRARTPTNRPPLSIAQKKLRNSNLKAYL